MYVKLKKKDSRLHLFWPKIMQRKKTLNTIKNKQLIYRINILYIHIFTLYASLEINKQSNPIPWRSIHNQGAVMGTVAAAMRAVRRGEARRLQHALRTCTWPARGGGRLMKRVLPGLQYALHSEPFWCRQTTCRVWRESVWIRRTVLSLCVCVCVCLNVLCLAQSILLAPV